MSLPANRGGRAAPETSSGKVDIQNATNQPLYSIDPDAGFVHITNRVPTGLPTMRIEQVVIVAPPALPAGVYVVEVIGQSVPTGAFQQFPGQPFFARVRRLG